MSNHETMEKPVENRILTIRGQKVLLDTDIAELYGVSVKRLNQQVKRNLDRFPRDFAFRLNHQEFTSLRSQFVTSKEGRGGRRYLPLVFTEHGAIMAATVLNSKRAIAMSVFVVRAFVRLREILAGNQELADKIAELERRVDSHDEAIQQIIAAIKKLMQPTGAAPKQIGFRPDEERKPKSLRARTQSLSRN